MQSSANGRLSSPALIPSGLAHCHPCLQSQLYCCPSEVQSTLSLVLQPTRNRASSSTLMTSGPSFWRWLRMKEETTSPSHPHHIKVEECWDQLSYVLYYQGQLTYSLPPPPRSALLCFPGRACFLVRDRTSSPALMIMCAVFLTA